MRLNVQAHPPDMTLASHRNLLQTKPLMLSAKQGGVWYHFHSLWYDLAGGRTPTPWSNHKASELVLNGLWKPLTCWLQAWLQPLWCVVDVVKWWSGVNMECSILKIKDVLMSGLPCLPRLICFVPTVPFFSILQKQKPCVSALGGLRWTERWWSRSVMQ